MSEVTRTRRVAQRIGLNPGDPGLAAYMARVEDGSDSRTVVHIDMPTYQRLGHPSVITVTVEPGDKLNAGHERPLNAQGQPPGRTYDDYHTTDVDHGRPGAIGLG